MLALDIVLDTELQQLGEANDGVERRADVVAHRGEKVALRTLGIDGPVAFLDQFAVLALELLRRPGALNRKRNDICRMPKNLHVRLMETAGADRVENGQSPIGLSIEDDLPCEDRLVWAAFRQLQPATSRDVVDANLVVLAENRRIRRSHRASITDVADRVLDVVTAEIAARTVDIEQQDVFALEIVHQPPHGILNHAILVVMLDQVRRNTCLERLGLGRAAFIRHVLEQTEDQTMPTTVP